MILDIFCLCVVFQGSLVKRASKALRESKGPLGRRVSRVEKAMLDPLVPEVCSHCRTQDHKTHVEGSSPT